MKFDFYISPVATIFVAILLGFLLAIPSHAQTVTGPVSSPVRELVMDVLQQAGIHSARMISRRRSTQQEAAFLYGLMKDEDNFSSVKKRYGPAAQKVIDIYSVNKLKSRGLVVALMDTEIKKQISLLGENRKEFSYVGPSKVFKFVVMPELAVDRSHFMNRFEAALRDHPDFTRWYGSAETGGAYQIEIPKILRTISGLWRGRCRETLADGEQIRYRHVMKLKRTEKGYLGSRKSPSRDGERWISSPLENLSIDRRSKKIAYSYQGEGGKKIAIVGRFNANYNRIKFEHNSSKAKCKLRKRL